MSNNSWEVYFRSGYQVSGAHSVVVEEYGNRRDSAIESAKRAALLAGERLKSLGLSGEVVVWVEKRRARRVSETEGREVIDRIKISALGKDHLQRLFDNETRAHDES